MLQVFYLDVAYVALAIYVCSSVCFKCSSCFKRMLQVFYLDVAYVANDSFASVCFECFICFRCFVAIFHLSVAKVDMDIGVEEVQALDGPAATAPLVLRR